MIKIKASQKSFSSITQASYKITGVKKGLGNTIGNMLRRTIISQTPGIAIYSYKLSCFKHEFDKCSYIVEDANEVMYNIKEIIFAYSSDINEEKIEIDIVGPCAFNAGMLDVPERLSIVNKDFVICNISENQKVNFQAIVRKSYGFDLHTENTKRFQENGFMGVTSVYSKIEKVNYKVEIDEISEIPSDSIILDIDFKNCYDCDFIVKNAIIKVNEELMAILDSINSKDILIPENTSISEEFVLKVKEIIQESELLDKIIQFGFQTPQELYEAISDAKIQKQLGIKKKQTKDLLSKIKEIFDINET